MISLLGSKKAAFGPPGCTLVIKIQKKIQIQTHANTYRNTKYKSKRDDISLSRQEDSPWPTSTSLHSGHENTKHKTQRYKYNQKKIKYNYKKYKYNYKNRKKQGMISVLGSKKTALGPPGCTLVIKGTRVWLRNTLLSKSCSQKYKYKYKSPQNNIFTKIQNIC